MFRRGIGTRRLLELMDIADRANQVQFAKDRMALNELEA